MKNGIVKTGINFPLFFILLFICTGTVTAEERLPEFYETQKMVRSALMEKEADVYELAARELHTPPETGQEAMFKLVLFLHLGMNSDAAMMVGRLRELSPRLGSGSISTIYYKACDKYGAWDVARKVSEVYADNVTGLDLQGRLLKHFHDTGWDVSQIDNWFKNKPAGVNNFWPLERYRFIIAKNLIEKEMWKLVEYAKENPEDINQIHIFLDAIAHEGAHAVKDIDMSWITAYVVTESADDAKKIASRLKSFGKWTEAAVFYRKAIEMPLSDDEVEKLSRMFQIYMPLEKVKAGFEAGIRDGLAECLRSLGHNEDAQIWMMEAVDIRERHDLKQNIMLAGQVQAASGMRIIEDSIRNEESLNEDDPQYWFKRADYYQGRKDSTHVEEALKKILSMTTPQPVAEKESTKGFRHMRSRALSRYCKLLKNAERDTEAVKLLGKEIEQTPPGSEPLYTAMYLFVFEFRKYVRPDDELFWRWLSEKEKWEFTEERLLKLMMEKTVESERDLYFTRAEKLTENSDPSRACVVGGILRRMGYPLRTIRLMEHMVDKIDDRRMKDRAYTTLFFAYLDNGSWRQARDILPIALQGFSLDEMADQYPRLALTAAAQGHKSEAMQIWIDPININLSSLNRLAKLADKGLKTELIYFYSELHEKLPTSVIPARALKILEK